MTKSDINKLSFLNKMQIMLFDSTSYTNRLDTTNNWLIKYSLIFSILQIIAFLLNQLNHINLDIDTKNNSFTKPNEHHLTNLFKIIINLLQAIYSPLLFDNIKVLYFITTYMIIQFTILIISIMTKYHTIHHILSFFILYHSHIFMFFIHNTSMEYVFNDTLYHIASNSSTCCTDDQGFTLILKILLIFLNILNLLLCFYYDLLYYNNSKHYILTKYSNIINIIYHFSRIIIGIIACIPYINQSIRIYVNSIFMILICIGQLYLLIKYNIFTIWKTIRLHVICYTIIFSISLLTLLSCIYSYNLYIMIAILIIIPLVCKIVTQCTLYVYTNRLYKKIEMLRTEWECLAYYYSFQNLYSWTLKESKMTIDPALRKVILNGLMLEYYQSHNHNKSCYCNWNNIKPYNDHNKMNHFANDRAHLNDFSRMLLENFKKKFPNSLSIRLKLINILIIEYKLYNKALLMIKSMVHKHKKMGFVQKFMIFEIRNKIENMINRKISRDEKNKSDIDILNLMKFLDFMKEFYFLLNIQLVNTRKFWQQLLKSEIELIELYNNAQKIFILNQAIQTLWSKIDNICEQKISKPYLLYSLYNYILINSKDTGDKIQQIYKKIIDMNIMVENRLKKVIHNNVNENNRDVLFQNNVYFMISGEKENLGMIVNCSDNVMSVIGYKKNYIIKHNFEIIIPPIYRKNHESHLIKYISNVYKVLYDHSSEMYFVNKNNDLCTCEISLKDLYHETYGIIFFVLIRPINHDNDFILMHDNGIIDCMSQNLRRDIGFQEQNIPKNTHIDSICMNLVSIEEFLKQKGIYNDNLLENNSKFLNGNIIQFISPIESDSDHNSNNINVNNNNNNLPHHQHYTDNYYLCYTEEQIINQTLTIRKAIFKKLLSKDVDISLLKKYKENKSKSSLYKSCETKKLDYNDNNNIPDEESIEFGLLKILDSKIGMENIAKKSILKDTCIIMEECKSPNHMLPSEKNPLGNMFSEISIVNIRNFTNYNPFFTQENLLKRLDDNIITQNKTENKIDNANLGTDMMNSFTQRDIIIDCARNFIKESELKNSILNVNEIDVSMKKTNRPLKAQVPYTIVTIIPHDSKNTLDQNHLDDKPLQSLQPSHVKIVEENVDPNTGDNKENKLKPLKKRSQRTNFGTNIDLSSGGYQYQKFIQKALKFGYAIKDTRFMKGFIYLFLIVHPTVMILTIYCQISSVDSVQTSISALNKNYDQIDNLLDINLYARLLYVVDSGLIPIDRLADIGIMNYHDFCLVNLCEMQYSLNRANLDFSNFLYSNINKKYRDEITLTEIKVHWDIEDKDSTTHGYSFSEQMYSISTVINLIIHQTFLLVHSNRTLHNLLDPQLTFILNNDAGALLLYNFRNSEIFEQALFEYLQIYLNIQVCLFCIGWILIMISWCIFAHIMMHRLLIEKIKILKIFTLIRPEETKVVLERCNYFDNLLKIIDNPMENIEKYLDQLFIIEYVKDNSIKQRKRIKPKIISKQIIKSYLVSLLKVSFLIGTLGIYYSLSLNSFIDFEHQNKILIRKTEFLYGNVHTAALSLSLTYQFLQRNATGLAYHDYPDPGNITTVLELQLKKEKDLMNLLNELSNINPRIDYLLSENVCDINPNISKYQCLKLANGALNLGLVGITLIVQQ